MHFSAHWREGDAEDRELSLFFLQGLLEALCLNFPMLYMDFSKGDLVDTVLLTARSGHKTRFWPWKARRILLETFGRVIFFLLKGKAGDQISWCSIFPLTWHSSHLVTKRQEVLEQKASMLKKWEGRWREAGFWWHCWAVELPSDHLDLLGKQQMSIWLQSLSLATKCIVKGSRRWGLESKQEDMQIYQ